MSDMRTSPYHATAARTASRLLDQWQMPDDDRAALHGRIVAALLDAYDTGFQHGVDAEPVEAPVLAALTPQDVVAVARRVAQRGWDLAWVPALVRPLLAEGHDLDAIHEALLAADPKLLELRPESGVGLLTPDDAKLCPRGARGVVLSWVRIVR